MGKFVIECPSCGRYAEAKTGIFARRRMECSCGHTIHIKTEKMVTRICPHCGNTFAHDQSDGLKVKCPVCHRRVKTALEDNKIAEFSCAQCGVRIQAVRSEATHTCPVCDHVNQVEEQLKKEQIRHDGLASIVKYEGDGTMLVWKHPIEDFNMGSQLIVHESQEAIFFKDGQALDLFGAGRYTIETQQLPLIEKIYNLPTDTEGTFHSEVYYVNMTTQMGIKWGTDTKVRLFDPMSGMYVELGASGDFNIRVTNSRKLLMKIVGTQNSLNQEHLVSNNGKGLFRSLVMTQVKSYLPQTIKDAGISVLEIDGHLMEISEALRVRINEYLGEYGLFMPEFFVSRVVTPDDDPNFRKMKEQFAAEYLQVREEQIRRKTAEAAAERMAVEAQTEARMKIIGAQGEAEAFKIQKAAEAEAYRLQAEAEAMEMQMKGYTYQQETARMVGMEALKNGITGNGEGGNSLGGGIAGGLGDLASLGITLGALGGVVGMTKEALDPMMQQTAQMGQAISGTMTGTLGGINGTGTSVSGNVSTSTTVNTWDCSCGNKGITAKFCGECGAKRPEPKLPDVWDCTCGNKGITAKFCGECGRRRGE